ncbi:MAG TPA: erythromycin esterase family protein [Kofleriaceae bacterium]|nr:erythromycin esterase family protein [Kofleriaceae bacterium]
MRWLPLVLPVVLHVACARPHVESPRLAVGAGVEKPIASGETHHYAIELAQDQVLFAAIDQLGADVVVSAYAPDGTKLAEVDSPTGAQGSEQIRVDAKQAGTYRVDVKAFPEQHGAYRARVVEIISAREMAEREAKERAIVEKYFTDRSEVVDGVVAWAKQAAIGDDFAGIEKLVGDARVISLGEADHGVHEYLAYRNRLAKYLIEKLGVTAILVESGFTETTAVDDYVLGIGTASARDVARAVFAWAMPMTLADNLELVEWLRAYNQKAARKVHVYGIDVTGGRNGEMTEGRLAVEASLAYLAQHDRATHAKLEPRLTPLLPRFTVKGYLELTDGQRAELTTAIADLLAAFKTAQDTPELRRARQHAAMAAVLETYFRENRERSLKKESIDDWAASVRDATMAANVIWSLEQEGAGSRVFLFTHNGHARRCERMVDGSTRPAPAAMGQYLAKSLRDKLVVIGFLHGDGPPTMTLDGLFARVGLPSFAVDLRAAPETVRAGLNQPWSLRSNPAWSAKPAQCFDALTFTSTVSSAPLVK